MFNYSFFIIKDNYLKILILLLIASYLYFLYLSSTCVMDKFKMLHNKKIIIFLNKIITK
jgi:hypothetical protein